ncbi:FMN-dependent NADH-azoreductase [Jannaschia pohangensis]|uniref:FMN dependent NADH:quinone oxidoreductase n=1 Tax=Jannaschia pohangensis TaxID=390807 RepID=A0A1I3QN74_9RHOB|nr:NAD(P)H-dependent oxidoreductase [Jannaschia pohangensis]SFJ35260.1 FMN-dependent NADH-azoreductase [Jannaschia pohangensis]
MPHILRIDTSAKPEGSVTASLLDQIEARIGKATNRRDLGRAAVPQIDGTWVGSNFTPSDQRTEAQKAALALSDELVAELQAADTILIAVPIYNFTVPGSLKAWIDLVCRVGVTFKYTETGPVGLLEGKRAIVAVASGGTKVGSEIDFATPYMRHILGFIGITDVTFIAADQLAVLGDESKTQAESQIETLAA